jgi:hypothetical protein
MGATQSRYPPGTTSTAEGTYKKGEQGGDILGSCEREVDAALQRRRSRDHHSGQDGGNGLGGMDQDGSSGAEQTSMVQRVLDMVRRCQQGGFGVNYSWAFPNLYRQYRAKTSQPAAENSNAQQIQPPGDVNQMPASPIVRPGSAERSMQSPPLAFNHGRCDAATEQQHRLFYDVRRIELLENFSQVRNGLKRKQTHLSELGSVADYLFENGRPARCWTTEQPEDMMDASDYLLLNEMEHLDLMREGKVRKPVVVRDEGFRFRRPKLTLDGVFQEYLSGPQRMVHVKSLAAGSIQLLLGK